MSSIVLRETSKLVLTNGRNVRFTELGLICLLGSIDYEATNIVTPVFGAIIDRCCGSDSSADIIRVFTAYSDIVNLLFSKLLSQLQCLKQHGSPQNRITFFKSVFSRTFDKNKSSHVKVQKLQATNQSLRCDLRYGWHGETSNENFLKFLHKDFMRSNSLLLRGASFVLNEAFKKENGLKSSDF